MFKSILFVSALALAALGWQQERNRPVLSLKEEAMTLRYAAGADEGVILVEAESEARLDHVQIVRPDGQLVFELRSPSEASNGVMRFAVEMLESDMGSLSESYPEGVYDILARTADGRLAKGSAFLSHALPLAPQVVYPRDGAIGVPSSNLVVTWLPDRAATGYRVDLEQNENDGLTVQLPAGSNSLRVPDGVLAPGTETSLEVSAIGANGNCTLVELRFTTK